MIISLKIKNFYSIQDTQFLDLSVRDNKDDNLGYCDSVDGKVSKFSMLIGSNASGKTNVLKGLSFLQWFMARPPVLLVPPQPDFHFPYKSFFESENSSDFEVVFEIEKKIYTYFLSLDRVKVLEEKLSMTQEVNVKTGTSLIFHRKYNENTHKYDVVSNKIDNFPTQVVDLMQRGDLGVISIGSILNIPQILSLNNYWRYINTNVNVVGYSDDNLLPFMLQLNSKKEMKLKVEKILKKFDIGLEEIILKLQQMAPNNFIVTDAKEKHIFEGKKFENDIQDASHGTKRLISILVRIISAFENGAPVIFDELDAFLHPAILEEIINMFFDEEINPKNAQLFFSSHSHAVMNKLDKYQIVIVEKNKNGATEIKRLDKFSPEIRNDDNFYKKYIAGVYGGVPNL